MDHFLDPLDSGKEPMERVRSGEENLDSHLMSHLSVTAKDDKSDLFLLIQPESLPGSSPLYNAVIN